jgi:phospholipid/cholesterol/gamma-HCH transport system substrate-binding protein
VRNSKAIEILVGLFIVAGMVALLVLALKVSGLGNVVGTNGYRITAAFDNVGDLKVRAPVTIAGVRVGEVAGIHLDNQTFRAVVTLQINPDENDIPTDSSASILTQGLLGSNYISLTPGFDNTFLKDGDKIDNTHPAIILENIIGQVMFKLNNSSGNSSSTNIKTGNNNTTSNNISNNSINSNTSSRNNTGNHNTSTTKYG